MFIVPFTPIEPSSAAMTRLAPQITKLLVLDQALNEARGTLSENERQAQMAQEAQASNLIEQVVLHPLQYEDPRSENPSGLMTVFELTVPGIVSSSGLKLFHELAFEKGTPEHALCTQDPQPGRLREQRIKVAHHVAPEPNELESLLKKWDQFYAQPNSSLIQVLAGHHRLCWIHPFADGNGRAARYQLYRGLQALGLAQTWSPSSALLNDIARYWQALSKADQLRKGAYDGRGRLSEVGLVDYAVLMISVFIAEIERKLALETHWV